MIRKILLSAAIATLFCVFAQAENASAQNAYGQAWGGNYTGTDWNKFYHYPYTYYPQNYWGDEYYRSADSLYHRYPPEMRIPVYNKQWHNYYPNHKTRYVDGLLRTRNVGARYHQGHHFILDVF